MGSVEEPDRKFALLLQHELDSEYARYTQHQISKNSNTNSTFAAPDDYLNSSKGIIDPNLELLDPTPNITNLFIAFNEKYFWGKLVPVCVVWGNRMMSSAGICSYEGRGGLCKISLSAPLLKLRPRKDLVETLLHEMIHAFLFVTDNNSDRDGHGPEFHRHMYRINTSAGTNITVCHSFHDEVRLYQQHWWRCDGPCQKRHPFYGIVRRSCNRAPGPNDRWYAHHDQTCGGKFIKIKEPEKSASKKKVEPKTKPNIRDIRDYINISNSPAQASTSTSKFNKNNGMNNIHGFHDLNLINTSTMPRNGFNTYNNSNRNGSSNGVVFGGFKKPNLGSTGVKFNSSSTLVVTTNSKMTKTVDNANTVINSKPTTAITAIDNKSHINYDLVRNHWVHKFESTSFPKRSFNEDSNTEVVAKKPKINATDSIVCPVCSKTFAEIDINDHIDVCLKLTQTSETCKHCGNLISTSHLNTHLAVCPKKNIIRPVFKECPVCLKKILLHNLEEHVNSCIDNNSCTENVPLIELKQCEICYKRFIIKEYDFHIHKCIVELEDSFNDYFEYVKCSSCGKSMDSDEYKIHKTVCVQAENDVTTKHCHICMIDIKAEHFSNHLLNCVDKAKGNISNSKESITDEETVSCLVCNERIIKSHLEQHLDICMKDTVINITDSDEDDTTDASHRDVVGFIHCPICINLFKHEEMNSHLDDCLKNN